jgi:nucleotide-binding universal stress UspA family protein
MHPASNTETRAGAGTGLRIERILCPIDFSECSASAYRHAQFIAGRFHATLIVQYVAELDEHLSLFYTISPEVDNFRRKLISDGHANLRQFITKAGGVQPECIVLEGSAADTILSLARERAVSLIVLGTHGRRGFDRLMLGSVTERVLRHASCPVLAIRQSAPDSDTRNAKVDTVPIRRVLCCIDFSVSSERVIEYALAVADAYDAEVTLLHILEDVPGSVNIAEETTITTENLEKLLPPADRSSIRIHLEIRVGRAYREILQFASEAESDLIVAGVRGRQTLDRAVFGSTTYRVIQLGPCPVLAVPS